MSNYYFRGKHFLFRIREVFVKKCKKKGTGYFFCMNCPRAETALFLPGKVACPPFFTFFLFFLYR